MEIKKSSKADLEKGRGKRFLLALLLVLLMGYIAFQWKTEVVADSKITKSDEEMFVPEADFPFAVELQPEPEIQPELTEHQDMDKIELTDDAEENPATERMLDELREQMDAGKTEMAELNDLPDGRQQNEEVLPDSLPVFPGGNAACMRFLSRNVVYPPSAVKSRTRGCVLVQFVVEKDGRLTDFKILRSVSPLLDKEALRVLKMMPRWIPGRKNGKAARFLYVFPVDFRLR